VGSLGTGGMLDAGCASSGGSGQLGHNRDSDNFKSRRLRLFRLYYLGRHYAQGALRCVQLRGSRRKRCSGCRSHRCEVGPTP
jgi:hypothetical protein